MKIVVLIWDMVLWMPRTPMITLMIILALDHRAITNGTPSILTTLLLNLATASVLLFNQAPRHQVVLRHNQVLPLRVAKAGAPLRLYLGNQHLREHWQSVIGQATVINALNVLVKVGVQPFQ